MSHKTLASLVREELGTDTFLRTDPVTTTVGATAQQIVRQNPNRVWLMFVNLSANDIHIGPFQNPSSSHGILITPSGGNASLIWRDDMDLIGYEWFAVAGAAASNVLTLELLTVKSPEGT